MPRSAVVGNGNMLVTFDDNLLIRDLYFPHVGLEDHTSYQHFHRIGIYENNELSWLYNGEWKSEVGYIKNALITRSKTTNERLGLSLVFNDFVYPTKNICIRKIELHNHKDIDRYIKVFVNQDFDVYGNKLKDTALMDADTHGILHYRQERYFLVNGQSNFGGISSYTTGKAEYLDFEGTWRDAEDGKLEENPIDQGSVDSTIEFEMHIKAGDSEVLYLWYCAGKNYKRVKFLNDYVLKNTPERLLENAIHYWRSWVNKCHQLESTDLSDNTKSLFKRSLLTIRTQIDNDGGIIAANDSDIMKFNKDTYTYVWPRDGAYVCYALDDAGYGEISERFYRFCARVITEEGYLLHKYNPDGSWGSSWHPWINEKGEKILPIQEDETALVIRSIWHNYKIYQDIEFLQEIYNSFVFKAAGFLIKFIDKKTGLPKPSYDLWEEKRSTFAYTVASTYSGLMAAINIAETLGRHAKVPKYKKAAKKIKSIFDKYFYDEKLNRYIKSVDIEDGKIINRDITIDASILSLSFLELIDHNDPKMVNTAKALHDALWVNTDIGGIARYQNDNYQRPPDTQGVPGNPWILTTLWYADYLIVTAKDSSDLHKAKELIEWAASHANKAGMLPEQIHPYTGEHLSVSPLTWSHANFIQTLINYDKKWHEFNIPLDKS